MRGPGTADYTDRRSCSVERSSLILRCNGLTSRRTVRTQLGLASIMTDLITGGPFHPEAAGRADLRRRAEWSRTSQFFDALNDLADRVERALSPSPEAALGGNAKRLLDIGISAIALFLLSPVMILVALLIRIKMGNPIIFSHWRVGYDGKPFRCLKFRTMVCDGDAILQNHLAENPAAFLEWQATQKLKNDPRVTAFGNILRRTSIDELPQLLNVLRGDMSCVGPRPVHATELARYGRQSRHYLRARPGLTGQWQVSGRNSTSHNSRIAMDTLYVRNWSLAHDIALMVKTIPAVLRTSETS